MRHFILGCFILTVGFGCESSSPQVTGDPDDPAYTDYEHDEMEAAMAKARDSVDEFLKVLNSGEGTNFAVKAPITDENGTEHFWLTDLTFENGEFKGRINNKPGIVENVTNGQQWSLQKDEISDWLYFRNEKMHGNYTLRPLLKSMPADEAAQLRAILADP